MTAKIEAAVADALRAQLATLQAKLDAWATWGVAEIATRNINVKSYVEHWEGRTLVAESALAAAERKVEGLEAERDLARAEAKRQGHNARCYASELPDYDPLEPLKPDETGLGRALIAVETLTAERDAARAEVARLLPYEDSRCPARKETASGGMTASCILMFGHETDDGSAHMFREDLESERDRLAARVAELEKTPTNAP